MLTVGRQRRGASTLSGEARRLRSAAGAPAPRSSIGRPTMKPWAMSHLSMVSCSRLCISSTPSATDGAAQRMSQGDGRLDHDQVAAIVAHRLDETLVDLDLAGRDLLQIFQRRQAGAVIVDGDLDAEVAQARKQVDAMTAAGHRGGFGQFERQPFRGQPMAVEDGGDLGGQAAVVEHPRRQIDGNVEIDAALDDLGGRLDGPVDDEIRQRLDAVMLLGGGDEFDRADRPFSGCVQRAKASAPIVRRVARSNLGW